MAGGGDGEKFRQALHNAEDGREPWPPLIHRTIKKAREVVAGMTRAYSQRGPAPSSEARNCFGVVVHRVVARDEAPPNILTNPSAWHTHNSIITGTMIHQ
jgi:hypothetical protein